MAAPAVYSRVDRQAQLGQGVDGVEPLVLQRIGLELVEQADPPTLVPPKVDHDPTLAGEPLHGQRKLRAAVAALGAEGVAGQTLPVQPNQA
jgi:hypothetical protein